MGGFQTQKHLNNIKTLSKGKCARKPWLSGIKEEMAETLSSTIAEISGLEPTLFFILMAWIMVWKGLAMWRAAKRDSKIWFVIFLIFTTAGILEILYIFIFSKMGGEKTVEQIKKPISKSKKRKK